MLKISEGKLLQGFEGLTIGGELVSVVNGCRFWWCYRKVDGLYCPVVDDRDDADFIEATSDPFVLESWRQIPLAKKFLVAQAIGFEKVETALASIREVQS